MMTGIDYKRSNIGVREKFAVTKKTSGKILADFKDNGAGGCVIISTCNRTELYASIQDDRALPLAKTLCAALGRDFSEYELCLTERVGEDVMKHLCRVASGLDSQITGDDQIITQVREALELSRGQNCTDSFIETMFNMSIHAAKAIKTKALANSLGTSSVPEKTVEKLKTMRRLAGKNALVIGNGRIGRTGAELLIREGVKVTVTLRSHKGRGGEGQIPDKAGVINYDERYRAMEKVDIAVSATASPHLTISENELSVLKRVPEIIVDLAVPRDVEPSVKNVRGVTLLTIDDISGEGRRLSPESILMTESIIAEHITKYNKWISFKENKTGTGGEGAYD
jgi:glutamyl-tRNA reductase